MTLQIIGTGSTGNCYILKSADQWLMIECGLVISKIKKAIGHDRSKLIGCIATHEHLDHAKGLKDLLSLTVPVFSSAGTFESLGIDHHRANIIKDGQMVKIGSFTVRPFGTVHDAAEPFGFLIHHIECGTVLFLTDTLYSPYKFSGLNNIIIEANFSKKIMDARMHLGNTPAFLRNRILKSHLSLENAIDLLQSNDLSKVNNIVLIHLSDNHSDEVGFMEDVVAATGKNVTVARNKMEFDFNKTPFQK